MSSSLPIHQSKTAADVVKLYPNQEDKTYLITGASNGIGYETARVLSSTQAKVIICCRPGAKATAAYESLMLENPNAKLELIPCDLGSPASVIACAKKVLSSCNALNALINNAGINGVKTWGLLTPGIETQFATNLLGHFLLTKILHPLLSSTPNSRVVNLSSDSHYRLPSNINFDKSIPPPESTYDPLYAYAFSNLCRIWWTSSLSKHKTAYPSFTLHPAIIANTGMMRHMEGSLRLKLFQIYLAIRHEIRPWNLPVSAGEGARTQVYLAMADVEVEGLVNGKYYVDCKVKEVSKLGTNEEYAEKLWNWCESWAEAEIEKAKAE